MKTLKFRKNLSELILKCEKTITWRFFDDKNLEKDDVVSFLIWETGEEFGRAKLISVKEKPLNRLSEDDWIGHEKFDSDKEMFETYSKYYNQKIDENSLVKIIRFELV
ncbi:ASCH domain-containing protein [Candidatus Woesearchaeota archaeon]|nr:ASCH domain-containing protein [Candidatus Woesearchaeota archaeon]